MLMSPPKSESELETRANTLAGSTLEKIATQCDQPVPENLHRDKGWVGQLLELALGATAASKPKPDFELIDVELKTIPINQLGKAKESTFVSTVDLLEVGRKTWETSVARKKLARVLWMPIEAEPSIPLAQRRVGTPILWSPSPEQENTLMQDWQELTDMISMGQLEQISARYGKYLQLRPKGANKKSLCWGINEFGEKVLTLPRGFYLRTLFTNQILESCSVQGGLVSP